MVADVFTRMPLLSRAEVEYDQVGPVMKGCGIWKIKTIRDEISESGPMKMVPLQAAKSVNIEYFIGAQKHVATVTVEEGRILCRYCIANSKPVAWCMHIQFLAKNHTDCSLFLVEEETQFLIPVVPTDGVFVPIKIVPDETRVGYFDAVMELSENKEDGEVHDVTIGQLYPEFGMLELRSIIADFMEGWLENEKYFHTSKKNSYPADISVDRMIQLRDSQVSPFSNRFYMAAVGESLGYWESTRVHSNDAPVF